MAEEQLKLVKPSPQYEADFLAMAREYAAEGTPLERAIYGEAAADFKAYIRKIRNQERGKDLPLDWVPQTTYWLVRDDRTIVATGNLRHYLTPRLQREYGHVGYGTRPSERGRGYGTIICRLVLAEAAAMGISNVLITCDADNVASARIIEKNGGVLENQVVSLETGKLKNRYWVDAAAASKVA